MREQLKSPVIVFGLLLVVIVGIGALTLPVDIFGGILLIIRAALAIVAAVLFWPLARDSVRVRPMQSEHYLGLGVFVVWLALALSTAFAIGGAVFHYNSRWSNSVAADIFIALSAAAAMLHIASASMPQPPAPQIRSWWPVMIAVSAAALIIGLLVGSMPLWYGGT